MRYVSMKSGLGVYIANETDDPDKVNIFAHNIGVLCLMLDSSNVSAKLTSLFSAGAFTPVKEVDAADSIDNIREAGIQIEEI